MLDISQDQLHLGRKDHLGDLQKTTKKANDFHFPAKTRQSTLPTLTVSSCLNTYRTYYKDSAECIALPMPTMEVTNGKR